MEDVGIQPSFRPGPTLDVLLCPLTRHPGTRSAPARYIQPAAFPYDPDYFFSPDHLCMGQDQTVSLPSATVHLGLEGMLSSSDLAGKLFTAVPAGMPFPVGPVGPYGMLSLSDSESVGPVGPYGTLSPSATVAVGPVGPYGTLSPSDSESVGPVGPYGMLSPSATVAVGPVGPYGALSPSDSDSVGPVGPCGTLSPTDTIAISPVGSGGTLSSPDPVGILFPAMPAGIPFSVGPVSPIGPCGMLWDASAILVDQGWALPSSDLAGMMVPNASMESAFLMSPVGPAMTLGVLPPSDSDSDDPVVPARILSSSVLERAGPRGPVEPLLPGKDGTGLFPTVTRGELLSVVAAPFPAGGDPAITQLPTEGMEGECSDVVNKSVTEHGGRSVPEVVITPAVVAMVGLDVMPMRGDTPLDRLDKCVEWDIRDQFETIDGMPVYYGGDLCDSHESEWDDPYDIACAEYVENYNFDALEGMQLKIFNRWRELYGSEMMESEGTGLTNVD